MFGRAGSGCEISTFKFPPLRWALPASGAAGAAVGALLHSCSGQKKRRRYCARCDDDVDVEPEESLHESGLARVLFRPELKTKATWKKKRERDANKCTVS